MHAAHVVTVVLLEGGAARYRLVRIERRARDGDGTTIFREVRRRRREGRHALRVRLSVVAIDVRGGQLLQHALHGGGVGVEVAVDGEGDAVEGKGDEEGIFARGAENEVKARAVGMFVELWEKFRYSTGLQKNKASLSTLLFGCC